MPWINDPSQLDAIEATLARHMTQLTTTVDKAEERIAQSTNAIDDQVAAVSAETRERLKTTLAPQRRAALRHAREQ